MSQTGIQPTPTPLQSLIPGNEPPPTPAPTPQPPSGETPEQKTAREATEATAKAAKDALVAPIDVKNIVIPEGFEKDDALLGEFATLLNDDKLSRADRANKLIELQAKVLKAASEKGSALFVQQQQEWQDQVRSDPEIGGTGLDAKLGNIAKLLDLFGGTKPAQGAARDATKLRQLLDTTGAGNNPEMVRFLSNIAEAMVAEGKIVPAGTPSSGPKDAASLLFDGKK